MALLATVSGMSAADDSTAAAAVLHYPAAARGSVVDSLHGSEVADPYRWMETASPEVAAWVAAENAVPQPYLGAIPARAVIQKRLTELWNYEQYGYSWLDDKSRMPVKKGGRYFYVEKSGTQNQGVLYWATALDAKPAVLVDPNTLSSDATASLADYSISPDGRYVAYAVSDGGTDWDTWHVREVESGRDLPDLIGDTKFTGVSWLPDASAFYYSRYPKGADGKGDDQQQVSVYRHTLGAAQADDLHVYSITDNPRYNPYATMSEDGRWLVLNISYGFDKNAVHLRDLSKPDASVVRLLDKWDGIYEFLGAMDDRLYFKTTQGAPLGRVIAVDPSSTASVEVVPQAKATLYQASLVGGHVIASYLEDARSHLVVYGGDGKRLREIRLPGNGTAIGFQDSPKENETFFAYTDYLTPLSLYRYDVAKDEVQPFRKPTVSFDGSPYVTDQVFYTSKDGTRVPMFITRRKDAKQDGSNPTLLYGYGGFDVSLTPTYSAAVAAWLERGGIYAVANLRGGGEYGADWHDAGTKTKKQNVFDDFIAAAEYLIAKGYTSPGEARDPRPQQRRTPGRRRNGAAAGALRRGAAGRRRHGHASLPHGERERLCLVVRLRHGRGRGPVPRACGLFTGAQPEVRALLPADARDDRRPRRPRRALAQLQVHRGASARAGLRRTRSSISIETRAGHGAGKPTWMQVEDWANQWAFLAKHLDMPGGK